VYEANPKTTNLVGNPRFVEPTPRGDEDKTPFENFESLATRLLRVPKEEVDEKRAEREREKKRSG
jgi:hypothetical protein